MGMSGRMLLKIAKVSHKDRQAKTPTWWILMRMVP